MHAPSRSPIQANDPSGKPSADEKLGSTALHRRIALRAYQLYEDRGRTHGHDLDDWLTAEQEVLGASMGADRG
jgi:hypothetical protein